MRLYHAVVVDEVGVVDPADNAPDQRAHSMNICETDFKMVWCFTTSGWASKRNNLKGSIGERTMAHKYVHINYIPENGWVLSIMSSLLNSSDPRLRKAFEQWSGTPLGELGLAITTRMHMLGLAIRRLNRRVDELRKQIGADPELLRSCLSGNSAIALKDNDFAYELLLDMDSFIFETKSLYEIVGEFLVTLFQILFDRKITQKELKSLLSRQHITTRWIDELSDARILFFHKTAPWLAVRIEPESNRFDPVLLKKQTIRFENPNDLIEFEVLREIYEGFVNSLTELHRYVKEQIRIAEEKTGSRKFGSLD